MRFKTFLLVAMLSVMAHSLAFACPKGPRDSELSLSSVMRNFGRFLLPADSLVSRGPKGAGEKEFTAAIDGISLAMSCTDAVLHDPQGALWPTKAYGLPPAEREAYLKVFHDQMQGFAERLAAYQTEFVHQRQIPQTERDFTTASRLKSEVQDFARKAHEATK